MEPTNTPRTQVVEHFLLPVESALQPPEEGRNYWVLTGLAGRYDMLNYNRRLYPEAVVSEAIQRLQADDGMLTRRNFYSELDHPEPDNSGARVPRLRNTAAVVTKLWTEVAEERGAGGRILFSANVANNPDGQRLVSLIEAGARVGVSTRGYGTFRLQRVGEDTVQIAETDFEFTGIDFVAQPSVPDAGVDTLESRELTLAYFEQLESTMQEKPSPDTTAATVPEEAVTVEATTPETQAQNVTLYDTILAALAQIGSNCAADQDWCDLDCIADLGMQLRWMRSDANYSLTNTMYQAAMTAMSDEQRASLIEQTETLLSRLQARQRAAEEKRMNEKPAEATGEAAPTPAPEQPVAEAPETAEVPETPVETSTTEAAAAPESVEEAAPATPEDATEALRVELSESQAKVQLLAGELQPLQLRSYILDQVKPERNPMALLAYLEHLCRTTEEVDQRMEQARSLLRVSLLELAGVNPAGRGITVQVAESAEESDEAKGDKTKRPKYTVEQFKHLYYAGKNPDPADILDENVTP